MNRKSLVSTTRSRHPDPSACLLLGRIRLRLQIKKDLPVDDFARNKRRRHNTPKMGKNNYSGVFAASSTAMSLAGIICMMLGALVVTFDYPQIEYLGGFDNSHIASDNTRQEGSSIYDRLVMEFVIGVAILMAGVVLCMPKIILVMARLLDKDRQSIR